MQVGEQRRHLVFVETTGEGRHHPFSGKDNTPNLGVSGGRAARKLRAAENAAQVRRDFFKSQIIVPVAVCAASFVEMLPFFLLRREPQGAATGCEGESGAGRQPEN